MNDNSQIEEPKSSMTKAEIAHIGGKAVSGAKILTILSGVQTALRFVSARTTAKHLSDIDIADFTAGYTFAGVGLYFTDVGLAGGLIQKGANPTDDELMTVFLSQQALVSIVVAFILGMLPVWTSLLSLNGTSVGILVSSTLSLYFFTFRVIPMFVLERQLQFDKIARCELVENVVMALATIIMAILGFKAWALLGGAMARSVVGVVLVWIVSPWRPRGRFRKEIFLELAKFGLPFQLNAIIPALGGMWNVIILKLLLGKAMLGQAAWAGNISAIPMVISMVLVRVAYPAYSRLKGDLEAVSSTLTKAIKRLNAGLDMIICPFVTMCPVIIPVLFDPKWNSAIPIVQWLSLQAVVGALLGMVCSVQNALGEAAERMWVTIVMVVVRWGTGFIVIKAFGIAGYGPICLATNLLELLISGWLVRRHNPNSAKLLRELFLPLTISWFTLAAALLLGGYLSGGVVWKNALYSTGIWLAMTLIREIATPLHFIRDEFGALLGLLKFSKLKR